VLLTHKDDCTISIYNAETLELISKYTLKCEDTHGNDLTQFSEFALSFNGDYILAGDEKAKSVFNYDGKFIRNIEIEGIQIIDYFHDTYYIGLEDNESGDYTHKSLIKVDFVTLEKETVYEFESDSIVFGALDPKMEWIMFSQATITYFVDLKSKSTPIKMFQSDNDKQKYVVLGSKVGVLYWNEETFIMQVCVYEKSELVWSHQVEERGKLDIESLSFNDLNNEYGLVFLEKIGQNYRMHQFNETTGINYALKSVKNVTFQYPFLYYIKGQKEIWIQDMHNNIKIFYLNENIWVAENNNINSLIKNGPIDIKIILDYSGYYKIGKYEWLTS